MKWVTRDHVHMDRVACPWLIRRFVDPQAEFLFVPFGTATVPPAGAIPFALPGAELGPHDASGSTFRKILWKYAIKDRALERLADIINSGIVHVFSQLDHGYTDVAALKYPEGIGLDALSQGMMYIADSDSDDIEKSMIIYDALYAFCRAKLLETEKPELLKHPFPQRWDAIKSELHRTTGPRST